MKILISNAYCYLNKGDAGIIRAMVKEFKNEYPNARIIVSSLYHELDQGKYGDCEVVESIISPYPTNNKYLKVLRNTFLYLWISFLNKLGNPYNNATKYFKDADIIVSCGGGYFKARSLKQFLGDFMYHYIQFKTALDYKKPLVIYAQTIGEFNGNSFVLSKIRKILNKSHLVLAREPISYNYLTKFAKDNKNFYKTSDIAFLLQSEKINLFNFDKNSFKIGITLRDWHFPGKQNPKILLANYKLSVKETIKNLVKNKNIEIFIMPQVIGPGEDNDLKISREIYEEFKDNENINLLEIDISPEELKYLYSNMDLFIGTRMHSNIFALSEGVPCVAISYDLKTDGIMKDIGLDDYVVSIDKITGQELIDKVGKAILNIKDLKETINLNLDDVKTMSRKNNDLLFRLIRTQIGER